MTLAAGLWAIYHDPYYLRFKPRMGRLDWTSQKELLRLGLPMGGSYLIEICAFSFMALLVAREGMYVTGGHQIMANLAALSRSDEHTSELQSLLRISYAVFSL